MQHESPHKSIRAHYMGAAVVKSRVGCPRDPCSDQTPLLCPTPPAQCEDMHLVWLKPSPQSLHGDCDGSDVAGANTTSVLGLSPQTRACVSLTTAPCSPPAASPRALGFWQRCRSRWGSERDGCVTFGTHKGIRCVS